MSDKTNDKRIVVDGDEMYMQGKGKAIYARLGTTSKGTPHIKISTDLFATDIDDMIALLTEAKRELARRERVKGGTT